MGWFVQNGNYYQTSDDAGTLENVMYKEGRSDDPAALHTQLPTGRMVEDKSKKVGTVYTINKGYGEDTTGARISREGRKERRQAIRSLLHSSRKDDKTRAEQLFHNEYGQGEFADLFRNNGNLRRRAFRNQDFLNAIASREYSTNDVYNLRGNTLGSGAKIIADDIDDIVNPTLIRKTANGKFVQGTKQYKVPVTEMVRKTIYPFGCRSAECAMQVRVPHTYMQLRERDGLVWSKAMYDNINSAAQSRAIYGQKPEMADFHALPAELTIDETTENRSVDNSTPGTTTSSTTATNTSGSRGSVTLRSRSGSRSGSGRTSGTQTIKSTSPGTATAKTAVTTSPSQTTSVNQTRRVTTTKLPDGTVVDTSYGDWIDVN